MNMDLDNEEILATRKLLGLDKKEGIEEDIKILEKFKNNEMQRDKLERDNRCGGWKIGDIYKHLELNIAIENLLQDYERQKQRNEEHQKINGELREKVKELEIDLTTVYIKGVEDGKDKYKQKIKDEIEELKDTLKHYDEYSKLNLLERVNIDLIDSKIEILEELLRESEEK